MGSLPFWLNALIFVAAAAVVWVAGVQLSKATDVLDDRLHIGSAFGGLIVLAIATNLPEIAITVSAAMACNLEVAVGNILGGIAMQTVVLVLLDAFGRRDNLTGPLTFRAASLVLVLEAVVLVTVLGVVVAGTQLPSDLMFARLTPDVVIITAVWVGGLLVIRRAERHLPWKLVHAEHSGSSSEHGSGSAGRHPRSKKPHPSYAKMSTPKLVAVFAGAALATLAGGVALERAGDAAASELGLSGVLFGATVLALATSLPEISTGLQAIRQGDDELAVSDIFGGNAFLPVILLPATLISGQAVLPTAGGVDIYLTALAMLLTLVYVIGLILRPHRRVLGMGVDSLIVLLIYGVGLAGLFALA
ncbi:sodium:calcium antiporter [Homoserinibacter sp. GY 40078]|uniref:sodium:calcium antiporter n=1 Tax=Homoserinibacter sp. GY 40078 TaxID=2603275 RepID=UPI0011C85589|nr:sodium:calcium antiporter [Homoserinibacter sp. GY 40078]TXK19743.1 sodium:calcium antiporter [Homoserinibacter sp. GY 40078]